MDEFPSIFSSKTGQINLLSYSIEVTSPEPIRCKPSPTPLTKLGNVELKVVKMRNMCVIEPL